MHLYFMTRGVKQQRDLFVKFMETQMFKWIRRNRRTNKKEHKKQSRPNHTRGNP